MKTQEALTLVKEHLIIGSDLNPESKFRKVSDITRNGGYNSYHIRIGTNAHIKITHEMLRKLFKSTIKNGGVYNRRVFVGLYPKKAEQHPCHIHTVGQIFQYSGVMFKKDDHNYEVNR